VEITDEKIIVFLFSLLICPEQYLNEDFVQDKIYLLEFGISDL